MSDILILTSDNPRTEKPDTYIEKISDENIKNEKLIFQAVREDRVSFYRTLIREAFAQKKSIFICVPTRYDTEQWKSALTKGIEQYVFTFHSDISKKTLTKSYNECITEKHPILIIGTGMFLSIPRQDIATIIIESESSDSYKQFAKPYLDIRSFAEVLSSINKAKFILADTLLRPETLYRHDTGELGEVSSFLPHLLHINTRLTGVLSSFFFLDPYKTTGVAQSGQSKV
jgi:primosomal protein N'